MLAARRRARYGFLLGLHIPRWCVVGRTPQPHDRARADHAPAAGGAAQSRSRGLWLVPHLLEQFSTGREAADHMRAPRLSRNEAALGARGRRVWKRATRMATDGDPQRVDRLAHIRVVHKQLRLSEALAFGDVHDLCTRNHTHKRLGYLVADVIEHLEVIDPWRDKLSDICDDPAVTAAVERMLLEPTLATAG
jgi:hypothetical protein